MSSIGIRRIRPKAVDHYTFVAWLLITLGLSNVVELDAIFGKEASMCDEDFGIYAVTQREVLEQLVEKVINFEIVFGLSFSLKSIEFIQVFGLVVASTHEEVIWQAYLPREEGANNLTGETTTINEVTVKKIWVFL